MNTSEFRNLAEQVQKNKDDILKHFKGAEILADFGIRIIGSVLTKEELDAIPTAGLQYGDAYAVGTQSPFTYYIWTRANNISPVDYWFDFGTIAIAGPRGPQGPRGADGKDGKASFWYYTPYVFDYPRDPIYKQGDMILDLAGNVFYCYDGESGSYEYAVNIMGPAGPAGPKGSMGPIGPQGVQGPKGDTGDVGGFINIAGIIADEYSLPDPTLIDNLTVAYLVGAAAPYDLYIQVGSSSDEAQWFNAGPLNVATMVTVGGQYQNTWDADTKIDKETGVTTYIQAYVKDKDGTNTLKDVSNYHTPLPGAFPLYGPSGTLVVKTPTSETHCANKQYVDAKYAELLSRIEALEAYHSAKFYIAGQELFFEPGMTWAQWIASPYNTYGVTAGNSEGDYTDTVYVGIQQVQLYGSSIQITSQIYADEHYSLS